MAEEKQGTTNLRGEIEKGEIGIAPEDELADSEAPKAMETMPEIVTHQQLLEENEKHWPGYFRPQRRER